MEPLVEQPVLIAVSKQQQVRSSLMFDFLLSQTKVWLVTAAYFMAVSFYYFIHPYAPQKGGKGGKNG